MDKSTNTTQQQQDLAHLTLDQCRAAFMANIASYFIGAMLDHPELPDKLNRNVLRQTVDQLNRCVRELRRSTAEHHHFYLDRNVKRAKMLDLAIVIDCVARIGLEEGSDPYEEFLGLVLDCLDEVFYAQQNRRKMHFPKYKALFNLLIREIHADVNREPSQLLYTHDKQLYMRTAPPEAPTQIK